MESVLVQYKIMTIFASTRRLVYLRVKQNLKCLASLHRCHWLKIQHSESLLFAGSGSIKTNIYATPHGKQVKNERIMCVRDRCYFLLEEDHVILWCERAGKMKWNEPGRQKIGNILGNDRNVKYFGKQTKILTHALWSASARQIQIPNCSLLQFCCCCFFLCFFCVFFSNILIDWWEISNISAEVVLHKSTISQLIIYCNR